MTRLPLCHLCQSRHPYREHGLEPSAVITLPASLTNEQVRQFKTAYAGEIMGDADIVPLSRTLIRRIEAFSPEPQPIPERRWWRK